MNLIDKDALVAEIERLREEKGTFYASDVLYNLEDFINTLEVKEVDFESEWKKYFEHIEGIATVIIKRFAKHFFELGMRISNPITAEDRGMAEEIIINLKRVEQDYCIDLTKEIEWIMNKVQKGE